MSIKRPRAAGVLLHVTSLPDSSGIGDLGPGADRFLDWARDAGASLWQILPLGPTAAGHSPYGGSSAFAGNPVLISPELLARDGLLPPGDLTEAPAFPSGEVDHDAKVALLGGARALLYPVQSPESFGLVLAEAMACGTPVAALDCGPVSELVDSGVTGAVFASVDALVAGLPAVLALDRARVRETAVARFGVAQMVDGYLGVYSQLHDLAARGLRAPGR